MRRSGSKRRSARRQPTTSVRRLGPAAQLRHSADRELRRRRDLALGLLVRELALDPDQQFLVERAQNTLQDRALAKASQTLATMKEHKLPVNRHRNIELWERISTPRPYVRWPRVETAERRSHDRLSQ